MRGWTNEQIVDELILLKAAHGIRTVSFVDDVFTNRPGGGVLKLCQKMVDAKLDLAWCENISSFLSVFLKHSFPFF